VQIGAPPDDLFGVCVLAAAVPLDEHVQAARPRPVGGVGWVRLCGLLGDGFERAGQGGEQQAAGGAAGQAWPVDGEVPGGVGAQPPGVPGQLAHVRRRAGRPGGGPSEDGFRFSGQVPPPALHHWINVRGGFGEGGQARSRVCGRWVGTRRGWTAGGVEVGPQDVPGNGIDEEMVGDSE
jgi:hypothetical protein